MMTLPSPYDQLYVKVTVYVHILPTAAKVTPLSG